MLSIRNLAAVALACVSVTALSSKAAVIDDFSSTTFAWPLTLPSGSPSISAVEAVVNDFGAATRTSTIAMPISTSPIRPQAAIYTPVSHPVFEFAETSYQQATVGLTYTGFVADLSMVPVLSVRFDSYDAPTSQPLPIAVSVNGSAPIITVYPTPGAGEFLFDLTSTGANLLSVSSLSITFIAPKGSDFSVSRVQVLGTGDSLPEPTAFVTMGLPAMGLVLRRRR